jgi:hypothetical protein
MEVGGKTRRNTKPGPLSHSTWLKRISRNFNLELVAEIYRRWGWRLKAEDDRLAPRIEAYKNLLMKGYPGQETALRVGEAGLLITSE